MAILALNRLWEMTTFNQRAKVFVANQQVSKLRQDILLVKSSKVRPES